MDVKQSHGGLNTDLNPDQQPKGTYRNALNVVSENKNGNRNHRITEPSTLLHQSGVPVGKIIVGSARMVDSQIAVLSINDDGSSEIGVLNTKSKTYESIVVSDCLNFPCTHVDVTYRLRQDCENVIYFTDGVNPVRYFNFNQVKDFYTSTYAQSGTGTQWDCNKFNLVRPYTIPCFQNIEVVTGGELEAGAYRFAIQYLDQDFNPTNWIKPSLPVNVFDGTGSSNNATDGLGGSASPTNKAIEVTMSALDDSFQFYRYAILRYTSFNGRVTDVYYSPTIDINQNTFTFTGNTDGFELGSIAEIQIGKLDIERATSIEQVENKLILLNTQGKQVKYCDFQKFASKVKTDLVVEQIAIGADSGNGINPETRKEKLGYMGDEVYALGIEYIFTDGTVTPPYHIPAKTKTQAESLVIPTWNSDLEHIVEDETAYNSDPNVETWRIENTGSATEMAYWESTTEVYDNRDACGDVNYWGHDYDGNPLVGTPIRHHRFPSRDKVNHYELTADSQSEIFKVFVRLVLAADLTQNITINGSFELSGNTESFSEVVNAPLNAGTHEIEVFLTTANVSLSDFDTSDLSLVSLVDPDGVGSVSLMYPQLSVSSNSTVEGIKNVFGLKFSNIELPHPDIIGYRIVRAKRDGSNRTVLDTGISKHLRGSDGSISQSYASFTHFGNDYSGGEFGTNQADDVYTLTPVMSYENRRLSATHLRRIASFNNTSVKYSGILEDGTGSFFKEIDTEIEVRTLRYNGIDTSVGASNHTIEKQLILDPTSFDDAFEIGTRIYNLSHTNRVPIAKLKTALPTTAEFDLEYISLKQERQVHVNLDTIEYFPIHDCVLTGTSTGNLFGGDTYITPFEIRNTGIRKVTKTPWNKILGAIGIVFATAATVLTAGAAAPALAAAIGVATSVAQAALITTAVIAGIVGVTANSVSALLLAYRDSNLDKMASDDRFESAVRNRDIIKNASYHIQNESLHGIYVESEVNTELQQGYIFEGNELFSPLSETIDAYFRRKVMYFNEDDQKWEFRGVMLPEIYHVNPDFYFKPCDVPNLPLSERFDCCSDCIDTHTQRIHYSQQSFQEEQSDNYRAFLANNYRDIEGNYGQITDGFRFNDQLYIRTTNGLWKLPHSYQERVSGELISFIGTGEFFSVPPKLVNDTDLNTAGGRIADKWATVKHPFGVFMTNQQTGQVFNLYGKLETISEKGQRNFFKENLPVRFLDKFSLDTGVDYNAQFSSPSGCGVMAGYDTRFDRIVMTKKDYLITKTIKLGVFDNPFYSDEDILYYDYTLKQFFLQVEGEHVKTTLLEQGIDKSWTKSYSFSDQSWTSYHSYIPDWYLASDNGMFTYTTEDGLWEHNIEGSWRKLYGKYRRSSIELIKNNDVITTKWWSEMMFQTEARDSEKTLRHKTFNKIHIYNNHQSSGELDLVYINNQDGDLLVKSISDNDLTQALLNYTEGTWTVNEFNDMITDDSVSMFKDYWCNQLDKVLNEQAFSTDKDWTEFERFRSKYLHIRYILDTLEDYELVFKFSISSSDTQSIR